MICKHCRERIEWRRAPSNARTMECWRTTDGKTLCHHSGLYHEVDLRPGAVREGLRDVKNV